MSIVADIKNWFALAVPNPTDKNRCVQIGVHLEEVDEMVDALGETLTRDALDKLPLVSNAWKASAPSHDVIALADVNRQELLDSLCDQIVTAIGVGHMFGMDVVGALAEVNRSNFSKFKDGQPIFDVNGKIAKNPETYFKPDLSKFI